MVNTACETICTPKVGIADVACALFDIWNSGDWNDGDHTQALHFLFFYFGIN